MRRRIIMLLGSVAFLLAGINFGLQMQEDDLSQKKLASSFLKTQNLVFSESRNSSNWLSDVLEYGVKDLDSGLSKPVSVEKVVSKPVSVEKVVSKPVSVEKVVSKPVSVEKVVSKPVSVEKVVSKPVSVEKVVSKPVSVEKVVSKPVSVEKDKLTQIIVPSVISSIESTTQQKENLKEEENSSLRKYSSVLEVQTGAIFHLDLPERGWVLVSNVLGRVQILERFNLKNNAIRYKLRAVEAGNYQLEFSRQLPRGYEKRLIELIVTPYTKTETVVTKTYLSPGTNSYNDTVDDKHVLQGLTLEEIILKATTANEVAIYEDLLLSAKTTLGQAELKRAFDLLWFNQGYYLLATELGETFVSRFKENPLSAQVLYHLGRIFEAQGEERDLHRSYGYYKTVFEEYPITPYSRLSRDRMSYLDRFFFNIH